MRDLDATAFDSRDCLFPGCPHEARDSTGMCADHRGRTPTRADDVTAIRDSRGRVIPGVYAHLMEEGTPVNTCKMPDCTNPEKGSGGPWKGMCQQHISSEIARRQAVRHSKPKADVKPPPGSTKDDPTRSAAAGRSNWHVEDRPDRHDNVARATRANRRGRSRGHRVRAQSPRERHPRTSPGARGGLT